MLNLMQVGITTGMLCLIDLPTGMLCLMELTTGMLYLVELTAVMLCLIELITGILCLIEVTTGRLCLSNMTCTWTLIAGNPVYFVQIRVIEMDLGGSSSGITDKITVYEGTQRSVRLGDISWKSSRLTCPGPSCQIVFQTYNVTKGRGWKIGFNLTNGCYNILRALPSTSFIRSPGYPNAYFNNMSCTWIIRAQLNKLVNIEFTDIDVQGDYPECKNDKITILDIIGSAFTSIRAIPSIYCGSTTQRIETLGYAVWVTFETDSSKTYRGFNAKYFETDMPCGGHYTAGQHIRILRSPGCTSPVECRWTIMAKSTGSRVKIEVLHSPLDTNNSMSDLQNCYKGEYVEVYDGNNMSSPGLGIWCGDMKPSFISSGKYIHIVMKTVGNQTNRRFELKFIETQETANYSETLKATISGGFIMSPRYPFQYPSDLQTTWLIDARRKHDLYKSISYIVIMEVLRSDIGNSSTCTNSYVRVFDGGSETSSVLGTFCGSSTPKFNSSGEEMLIKFYSGKPDHGTGFILKYSQGKELPQACRGGKTHLMATERVHYIYSPNYPYPYPRNVDCTWRIDVGSTDKVVSARSGGFGLRLHTVCEEDYLEVMDGRMSGGVWHYYHLGKSCSYITFYYMSSGQRMLIKSHSESHNVDFFFTFTYSAVMNPCNQKTVELKAFKRNTYIRSPNYNDQKGIYPHNCETNWRIKANNSEDIIEISSETFSLEKTAGCSGDYVELFDGDDGSRSLGVWCGNNGFSIKSSGPVLFVRFRSDGYTSLSGFMLKFWSQRPKQKPPLLSTGAVIGIVIGIVAVCLIFMCLVCNHSRRKASPALSNFSNSHTLRQQRPERPEGLNIGVNSSSTDYSAPPPAYSSILPEETSTKDMPPPYSSVESLDSDTSVGTIQLPSYSNVNSNEQSDSLTISTQL